MMETDTYCMGTLLLGTAGFPLPRPPAPRLRCCPLSRLSRPEGQRLLLRMGSSCLCFSPGPKAPCSSHTVPALAQPLSVTVLSLRHRSPSTTVRQPCGFGSLKDPLNYLALEEAVGISDLVFTGGCCGIVYFLSPVLFALL